MPRVLNIRLDQIPKGAVFIGRPSKWGNQFVIGRDGSRAQVIEKHRLHLKEHQELLEAARRELAGKDLVCFCSPEPCHGDTLLRVAAGGDP